MIDLNFLPITEQKAVRKETIMLALKSILVWMVLTILITAILLSWSKYFLQKNLGDWQEQSTLVSSNHLVLADQITALNKDLKELREIQADYIVWSEILVALADIIPDNNMIEGLYINTQDDSVVIRGLSRTRDDLLALEANLKKFDILTDLKSPLSNLLSPIDINFEFRAKLKLNNKTDKENETIKSQPDPS